MLTKILLIYLLFGVVYSTYRLKKEAKRTYFMLRYTNVKYPAGSMAVKFVVNIVGWLPMLIGEVMDV